MVMVMLVMESSDGSRWSKERQGKRVGVVLFHLILASTILFRVKEKANHVVVVGGGGGVVREKGKFIMVMRE